jgi:bifunctional non-homologous end joining protein LigD
MLGMLSIGSRPGPLGARSGCILVALPVGSVLVAKLEEYREKRDAKATNEPMGGEPAEAGPTRAGAYVVHLHDATRRHYDLRLEVGGVLSSFAIPKGPTTNPEQKHLAVHTEDHPFEYLDFEAVIPDGQYGAGPMIVWDRGVVRYLEKPAEEGLAAGKLDFWLDGFKLHGRFALVRLKSSPKDWLLLKKRDAFASKERDIVRELPRSVLSGLTVEELLTAEDIGEKLEARAESAGAEQGEVDGTALEPMTAGRAKAIGDAWLYDLRFEGVRVLCTRSGEDVVVRHRKLGDLTFFYPDVARALSALPVDRAVLDGEIVAFDESGKPALDRLRRRIERARSGDPMRASLEVPVVLVASDLVALGRYDLRALPIEKRKELLRALLPGPGVLRASEAVEADAATVLAFCKQHGLPGAIAKKKGSRYESGDSGAWAELRVEGARAPAEPSHATPGTVRHGSVVVTNPNKIFWPDEGYTKNDLVSYYEAVAPAMLPHLRDRPIVLVRYPDGIHGKSFYQWNPPPAMPKWVGMIELCAEDDTKGKRGAFLANDERSLLYLANLAAIPIHVLAFRKHDPDAADFMTIDFDLKGDGKQKPPLSDAIALARTLKEILDDLELPSFPKTSGQMGLHVLVPLRGANFTTARALCDVLGQLLVARHPKIATMERVVQQRGAKVYVDTGQTGPTRTIVAPYSVRASPGATVSTPLTWDEVDEELDPTRFTIRTVPTRVRERGDPMSDLLEVPVDVARAVARLERHVEP